MNRIIRNLVITIMLLVVTSITASAEMKIHVLDVDQGLAVLIESEQQVLMYDGGGRETSSYVVSYLKQHNISTIDYLISSHYDEDHLAGLIGCLHTFNVKNVIGSEYEHDSALYNSFIETVGNSGLQIQYPKVRDKFSFGDGLFTILAPCEESENANNNSIVIKIEDGDCSVILTGDAEIQSEYSMLDSGMDLDADVLLVGHHGSNSSSTSEFLEAVNPEYGIISCGKENTYGHSHEEVMQELQKRDISVFRTDLQGTIIVECNAEKLSWNVEPCNDYSAGVDSTEEESTKKIEEQQIDNQIYILNTNTHKFHYPSCSSVGQMKDKNKQESTESRDYLIENHYDPCKNCNP